MQFQEWLRAGVKRTQTYGERGTLGYDAEMRKSWTLYGSAM